MQKYTDKYGNRLINLEYYYIRIGCIDAGSYRVNAGRTDDTYMDDIATYITAIDMDEAEKQALELLHDYIAEIKKRSRRNPHRTRPNNPLR